MNPLSQAISSALDVAGRGAKAKLAHDVDVSMSTVTRWASGQTLPGRAKWSAIERSLGMRAGTLETAHMAAIMLPENNGVPSAVMRAIQQLGAEIASLRSEVDELRSEVAPPRQSSDLASPAPTSTRKRPHP